MPAEILFMTSLTGRPLKRLPCRWDFALKRLSIYSSLIIVKDLSLSAEESTYLKRCVSFSRTTSNHKWYLDLTYYKIYNTAFKDKNKTKIVKRKFDGIINNLIFLNTVFYLKFENAVQYFLTSSHKVSTKN